MKRWLNIKCFFCVIIVFILFLVGCSEKTKDTASQLDEWLGNYEFYEYFPPNINMEYNINIYQDDDKYFAKINIDGFQTTQRIRADVIGNAERIDMVFETYLSESTGENIEKGEILLSLKKENSEINTYWGAIQPIVINDKEKANKNKGLESAVGDKKSISTTATDNPNNSESNRIKEQVSNFQINEEFYGSWIIKRTVAFGKVSALSDEDITKLIGKGIEYSSNTANFGNERCKNPKYKISSISEKNFFENNGYTSFKELGLHGDYVTMVEVFCEKEDYNNFWYTIGGHIFVKDKNTLIANYEGVFFELVKDLPKKENANLFSGKSESKEFSAVSGDWKITEYLGKSVEYHGAEATTEAERSENNKIRYKCHKSSFLSCK